MNPYVKKSFISRLPLWFKALFVKFWFAGAVFYFVGWGLPVQTSDQLDLTLVLGLAHGLVTDLMANRVLIYLEANEEKARRWLVCSTRKFYGVPVNLLFGVMCAFLTVYFYHVINVLALAAGGKSEGYVTLGAEPVLYGLIYLVFDLMFVMIKNVFLKSYRKATEA